MGFYAFLILLALAFLLVFSGDLKDEYNSIMC